MVEFRAFVDGKVVSFEVPEQMPIVLPLLFTGQQNLFDMLEVGQPHGGVKLRVFSVDADALKAGGASVPKIPKQGHLAQQFRRLRKHGAALYGVEQFGGMEAGDADVAKSKNGFPVVARPETMSSIVNHFQLVPVSDGLNGLNVTRVTIDMGSQDRGGLRADSRFDFVGIDV